jgi:hypothetical protein
VPNITNVLAIFQNWLDKPDPNLNLWSIVDHRRSQSRGTPDHVRWIRDYARNVVFRHVHIPILLNKINKVADKAKEKIRACANSLIKNP